MISLDEIRIASPCKSDWNEMYGDDRRRFCSQCKLNVYNLSGMTRDEAEQLVMNSEGRLCVRFFRRQDGTILTQDCPVGWKALKKRATRVAVALSSILAAFFAGVFSLRAVDAAISAIPIGDVEQPDVVKKEAGYAMGGIYGSIPVAGEVVLPDSRYDVGRVSTIQRFEDVDVEAWVK